MTSCTFYFTLTVWLAEAGGVANFAFSFFHEALTACRILFHCTFPLHFDCWLTTAVIFVAGAIYCITFQSGHGITFFLIFKQFYILPIHKSHPEIYRHVFSNRYGYYLYSIANYPCIKIFKFLYKFCFLSKNQRILLANTSNRKEVVL